METLKEGKADADAKVAKSLFNEALNGNVTAMIYWLKNRQSKKWRDKPEEDTDNKKPFDKVEFVD